MWDKYVTKGEPWGDESLGEFFGAAFTGVTTVLSGKCVVDGITNYKNTKYDILTSQCFVEGTLVVTSEGNKPIEEIQAGDLVYSTNPETGESEYKEVVQTFENETKELVHITVADEEIISTPKHPFYVPKKGWTSAIDLKAGDLLVLSNGEYVIVEKVQHEILEMPVKVYNFEVQDFHTYYVSKNSVLVHNMCAFKKDDGIGSVNIATDYINITAGPNVKSHYKDHKSLLEKLLGKKYPSFKKSNNAEEFLHDISELVNKGELSYVYQSTAMKGGDILNIYKGKGLVLATKTNGEWVTLLEDGKGMAIQFEMFKLN